VTEPERALVSRLAAAGSVVEVGVGNRPGIAAELAARSVEVTATDVRPRPVPDSVTFVVDDVTEPELSVYDGSDILFARNLPPELHRPLETLARRVGAACWFTTLGGDPPTVPVEAQQLPGGVTLYRTTERGSPACRPDSG